MTVKNSKETRKGQTQEDQGDVARVVANTNTKSETKGKLKELELLNAATTTTIIHNIVQQALFTFFHPESYVGQGDDYLYSNDNDRDNCND